MSSTLIAVTGVACRFPGAADAVAFWELLVDAREGLTRFTEAELDKRKVPHRLRRHPHYVPAGGLIDGQDLFDPAPFGLTDAEAELLDPQQRLYLECAWHALEQAGHGGGRGAGAVGVFAGSMHSSYLASNLADRWDPTGGGLDPVGSLQTAIATHTDYLPLQVAYRLGLAGPAIAVNSTCSTSLVAVHIGVQSLLAEECDTALAGGVSLTVPQGHGYLHVPDGIFAVDGRMRPFSAAGTGIVYSQGVGVVVLRRLDDALADGDPVLAVVHGSAVNNDGADKAGFSAPSMRGQARVIAEALGVAGLGPREIGHIEAHGSATRLGDPIETAALRRVFGDTGPAWCGLGSVKSNIGHANSAAGIASFVKTVLAIQHGVLPASLHSTPHNELLGLAGSPFQVVTATRDWDTPPHAGVSAFGIGGTNCHVVLGPAPRRDLSGSDPRPQLLVVSAQTAAAARAGARTVAQAAVEAQGSALPDLAHTLQSGRVALPHRIAAVASRTALRRLTAAAPVCAGTPRTVFAFPGAGAQYVGMGAALYEQEPVFAACVDECAALLTPLINADVRDALAPAGQARIRDASFGLPALFAVSLATARLLGSWGVRPDVVLGHSLGEYTAAVAAGALTVPQAARLVAVRCTEAARVAGNGLMLAVNLGEHDVAALLAEHPGVDLAVINSASATVLSGPADAITALAGVLRDRGLDANPLQVDAGLHSRLVEPALAAMRAACAGLAAGTLAVPLVSTVTGDYAGAQLANAEHWARQLRQPVRFGDALRTAVGSAESSVLVQVGPGIELVGLARWEGFPALHAAVPTMLADDPGSEPVTVREALGALWTHGVEVDFAALHRPGRRRIAAPGYCFQRRRLWIDPPQDRPTGQRLEADAAEPLQVPIWNQLPPAQRPARLEGRWMVAGPADELRAELSRVIDSTGGQAVPIEQVSEEDTGSWAGVVLLPVASGSDESDVTAEVLRHARLAATLAALPSLPSLLLLVTCGAESITGEEPIHMAEAAGRVLPRVLAQEQPGLRWRSLDLAPATGSAEAVKAVLTELAELVTGTSAEVAVRGRARWLRSLVSWRPAPRTEPHAVTAGTVLITGGLGDVGLLFAEHFASRGHQVVVTSRTGVTPGTERDTALQKLIERGLAVQVRCCDAGDAEATADLIAELAEQQRLDLVVHAAGVIAGADLEPLRQVRTLHVNSHVHAKVSGVLALAAALDRLPADRRPDAVVLMSSATVLVGGIGMGPYAASNAALDRFAASVSTQGTRWVSIVWDGWRVGPLGAERAVVLADALDAATGTRALDRIVAAAIEGTAPAVVAVSPSDLTERMLAAAEPRVPAGVTTTAQAALPPIEREIAELWSELFNTAVVSGDADFFGLGGHSLLATRMLGKLHERFGVELRLRELLDTPTVAGLAATVTESAKHIRPADPEPAGTQPVPGGDDGTIPMTRVQHAYWVGREGGYRWGDLPCHFYLEYDCPELDLERYQRAWRRVIARHPMLRASVTPQGRFAVRDDLPPYRIRVHDLTGIDEQQREDRLAALRERSTTAPGRPDRWPLFQVRAAKLPRGRVRLLIGVDALICDAASWWVLERELRACYLDPDTVLPQLGIGPAACVAALERRRSGPAADRAAAYWRARLDTLPGPPALPLQEPDQQPRFIRRAGRLSAAEWSALHAEAVRRRVTLTAVLLTAYADTLADCTGSEHFSVMLTLFDRPEVHPDVQVVVGDFTSLVLHEVPPRAGRPFGERATATQQRLFADLDHRELSALDVLAEASARSGAIRSIPVVFTSALGVGTDNGELEWVGEQVFALSQTPQTVLDHQIVAVGGELRLQFDALQGVLPVDELDRLVAQHLDRVRRLAIEPTLWDTPEGSAVHTAPDKVGEVPDVVLAVRTARSSVATLFLIHPSGGDVLCYAPLAQLLDDRVDVCALTDPVLAAPGSLAPAELPSLARCYVDAIRAYQPGEPYLLGGWSMGGTLAQEMACQLHTAGERVSLLVLLDSNDPTYITGISGPDPDVELVVRLLRALEAFLGVDLGVGTEAGHAELAALSPSQRRAELERRLTEYRLLGRAESVDERLAVLARHLKALAEHQAGWLADPTTTTLLLRADQRSPRNSGIGMGVDDTPPGLNDLGWSRHLAGPLRVVGIAAHHYALLHGAACHRVAEEINRMLPHVLPSTPTERTPR